MFTILSMCFAVACVTAPDASVDPVSDGAQTLARGGGGGGNTPAPTLVASWPKEIPLPACALTGSIEASAAWTAAMLCDLSYSAALASTTSLYLPLGYTQATNGTAVFNNAVYQIVFGGQNHDHSATQTDIVLYVVRL